MMNGFRLSLYLLSLFASPANAFFQSFFGCRGAGGCFFFLFGSTMHKIENNKCRQKCVFFTFMEPTYSCGGCPPSIGTSGLPGSSPTKAPTPRPSKGPTPAPTLRPTLAPTLEPTSIRRYSCPSTPNVEVRFVLMQETEVTIERSSVDLCTLTLVNQDGVAIPVARQYEGNGWERSGGRFAGYLREWVCSSSDCSTTLPAGDSYVIVTRSVNVVDNESARARFFEAATFGARPSDLLDNTSFEDYIANQIDAPATSHRELFRRRSNPRWEFHAPEFGGKLNPCGDENTTWKRQMFKETDDKKMMGVKKVGSYWEISIDGVVRSVLEKQPRFVPLSWRHDEFEDGKQYMICFWNWNEEVRRGIYRVTTADGAICRQVYAEDFIINFPAAYQPPQSLKATLPALSETSAWAKISDLVPEYRYRESIASSACSGLLSYSWDGPSIYAKTSAGEWVQFVPRVNVKANTVTSPLSDGGALSWSKGEVAACSNVARNPFNEDGCFVSEKVACTPGADAANSSSIGTLVCGSRGEVSNDPTLNASWLDISSIDADRALELGLPEDSTSTYILKKQPEFIWSEIALGSDDQIRQRAAWALFQIFALPRSALASEHRHSEMFLNYYDIFVRNAFGNYLDILREIAYSPLMAESLSYLYSKSTQLLHYWTGNIVFPDENFARELMQLFTIGLVELQDDGTPVLENSETIRTYDSEDIMSFARAWTGFEPQELRANIENRYFNQIDPMQINAEFRDLFPKRNLFGGYIGDDYPICADLPDHAFLKKGAKYLLLGSSPLPGKVEDDEEWLKSTTKRFSLQEGSGLYTKLCGSPGGSCSYPGVVVLDSDVSCPECMNIDEPRVLKVSSMYYEYVSIPCVDQTFFAEGRKISGSSKWYPPTCANPHTAVAAEACCSPGDTRRAGHRNCEFAGERMTYSTASARCSQDGKVPCDYWSIVEDLECPASPFHWTSEPCNNQKVKVANDGKAGVVQDWGALYTDRLLRNNTVTFFPLYWENEVYPTVAKGCGSSACQEFDGFCLCNVTVTNTAAFLTAPSSSKDILDEAHYGHADPSLYDGAFSVHNVNGYKYYCRDNNCFDQYTVFEVTDHAGRTKYFRNMKSTVYIGNEYSFRNPVQFHRLLSSEFSLANAEYETEAVLQHLFYHKNTAPFVATRMIQRFGISNPSPSYVLAVASAFRSGSYSSGGRSFGNGKYGDMASTIAAVLLDREARSLVLDKDPSYGSLREPILKVVSFMRAMEYQNNVPLVQLDLMDEKVGQQVYHQKSVFSYFRPEYSPPGDTSSSMLTAPEAEIMGASKIIGLLNGLFGLVKYGLVNCEEGFGIYGGCEASNGLLTFSPSSSDRSEMVRVLAQILTSGRMGESKQNAIVQAITREQNNTLAFQLGIQLILTSPEFHATNTLDAQASTSATGANQPIGRPEEGYKAVIHLSLLGGADSFNMLVPKVGCTVRDQYDSVRDTIALSNSDLLDLDGTVSGQPCNSFSVHRALPIVKELYDAGDALFISNMGVLTESVNKENYSFKTVTQLFAHNAMVDELNELDPFISAVGTGTLGRMSDVLEADGYRTGKVVVDASPNNLAGAGTSSTPIIQLDEDGITEFEGPTSANDVIEMLNNGGDSGVFGNLWSDILNTSLTSSEDLLDLLAANPPPPDFADSSLGKRMRVTAQMIAARSERKVDRDFFYLSHSGYDAHFDVQTNLNDNFFELNEALSDLVAELKQLGVWDEVVIVQTSDFGRTLTPNTGGGSDHGWGGNYFVLGGGVNGKRILGQYPGDLTEQGPLNVGRGRIIPTVPWESLFQSLAEWVGVKDFDTVLPNRNKFSNLFSRSDIFN